MGKIEDLQKELAQLQSDEKRSKEIKSLQKRIKSMKFSKTKSGKIFNKIADIGDGLGKVMAGDPKKSKKGKAKKPQKVKSLQQIMDSLPQ